ncbi:MAG TPA: hypothetical protein V6C89_04525 [Drouetiella sp.]|jgi:C-terminal processing protease CtpA/Prc
MANLTARSLLLGLCILVAHSLPSANATGTELKAETAQSDNSMPVESSAEVPIKSVAQKPLQGGVSKLDEILRATESTDLYKASVKKLSDGVKLTAEEYRSLGVGCLGFESDRTFFQKIAIVSVVYSGSPADQAGIRIGDKLIDEDNDQAAREHPEIPRWKVSFGQAGTSKQIVVIRHHKAVALTLTRMNIEDISDDDARQEWEQIIAKYGYLNSNEIEGVGRDPLNKDVDSGVDENVDQLETK